MSRGCFWKIDAIDWGTSKFRAFINNNKILDKIVTDEGMKFVKNNNFEQILLNNIDKWLKIQSSFTVLLSGKVGSKQGWVEVPYKIIPCDLTGLNFKKIELENLTEVFVFRVCQFNPDDVMRGEETQIVGFFYNNPNFFWFVYLDLIQNGLM